VLATGIPAYSRLHLEGLFATAEPSVQAPLSPARQEETAVAFCEKQQAKAHPLLVRKTKQILSHYHCTNKPMDHIYVK